MSIKYTAIATTAKQILYEKMTVQINEDVGNLIVSKFSLIGYENLNISLGSYIGTLHIMHDKFYFCCITEADYSDQQADRFLQEVKSQFTNKFGYNAAEIAKLDIDRHFSNDLNKIINNHKTGIKFGAMKEAKNEVNRTKEIVNEGIVLQLDNTDATQNLLDKSENIKDEAEKFEKTAAEFEKIIKKQMWWLCSKQCLMIFLIPAFILGVYFLVSFLVCDDVYSLIVGCRD